MKTVDKSDHANFHWATPQFLRLHAHGHAIDNSTESSTLSAVIVPLLIVLLTVMTIALQYYLMVSSHGHWPVNLPTFVDIPFAHF